MSIKMNKDARWMTWWVVGFFATFMIVDIIMVTLAVRTQTGVVVDRPYERGLDYNATIAAAQDQQALGITAIITYQDQVLRLHLRDAQNKSVRAHSITATVMRPVHAHTDQNIRLIDTKDGSYQSGPLSLGAGAWIVVVTAQVHTTQLTYQQEIRVP